MKGIIRKALVSVAVVLGGAMVVAPVVGAEPVFAECPEGSVPVSILGGGSDTVTGTNGEKCVKDDGKGSSVMSILSLVVRIMTVGMGILAAIGIGFFGIQYLTAADDEAKVKKAKNRMIGIVIGLAVYVVIVAIMGWLMPGFEPFL